MPSKQLSSYPKLLLSHNTVVLFAAPPQTAFSFKRRFEKGQLSDLKDVMGRWKPWTPPRTDQALQQGGMFVFDGNKCVWSHYDKGTGSHADLSEVLGKVGKLVEATSNAATAMPDCGDSACDIPK